MTVELEKLLHLLSNAATEITIFVTTIIALITIWLKSREVDVTSVTTITRLQQEQMVHLMDQNARLSKDIDDLRALTTEQFNLIQELRQRIVELENLLSITESYVKEIVDQKNKE